MALKTAFLFFGTILISLQFCHVSCDTVGDGEIKVDVTSNGRLSFECSQNTYRYDIYKCKFQLSNGIFIEYKSQKNGLQVNMTEPVKYQITHASMADYKTTCKIEVDPPFDLEISDRWKCWIISRDKIFKNFLVKPLNATSEKPKPKPKISSSAVFVKTGDTFMAGCQVMHPIDYCYLVSPNGTQYAVTKSAFVPSYPGTEIQLENYKSDKENYNKRIYSTKDVIRTRIPSENSNFATGDCFTMFPNANKNNEGNWTCQLHLANSKDSMALNFTVNVTDSYLIPAYTKDLTSKTLSCNAIPTLPSKVVDCRWAFLNSTMISSGPNVTMTHNSTSCEITYKNWNSEWHTEKWACFVQFENDFGERFHASDIVSSSTISLPMLINIVLLTIFSLLHYVYTC